MVMSLGTARVPSLKRLYVPLAMIASRNLVVFPSLEKATSSLTNIFVPTSLATARQSSVSTPYDKSTERLKLMTKMRDSLFCLAIRSSDIKGHLKQQKQHESRRHTIRKAKGQKRYSKMLCKQDCRNKIEKMSSLTWD